MLLSFYFWNYLNIRIEFSHLDLSFCINKLSISVEKLTLIQYYLPFDILHVNLWQTPWLNLHSFSLCHFLHSFFHINISHFKNSIQPFKILQFFLKLVYGFWIMLNNFRINLILKEIAQNTNNTKNARVLLFLFL